MKFSVTIEQVQEGSYGYDTKVAEGMTWSWGVRSEGFYGYSFEGLATSEYEAREDVSACIKKLMERVAFKHPQAEAVERQMKKTIEEKDKAYLVMFQRAQAAEKAANEANERAAKIEAGRSCVNFVEPVSTSAPEAVANDDEPF